MSSQMSSDLLRWSGSGSGCGLAVSWITAFRKNYVTELQNIIVLDLHLRYIFPNICISPSVALVK